MESLNPRLSKPKLELEGEVETQDETWLCRGASLMVCHTNVQKSQSITLYDASQQIHHTKASQEFTDRLLCGSQGDWILAIDFYKNRSECCILNAVTMKKFQVPTLGEHKMSTYNNFLLFGSPCEANCYVFVITSFGILNYYKIGASELNKQELGLLFSHLDRAITIFQGRMYYIEKATYNLKCSQLIKDPLVHLQFEECIDGYELKDELVFGGRGYLFESDDCLLYVHERSLEMGVRDFQVFRADLSGKFWEEINSIGSDHAIFMDQLRGFSAHVPPGGVLKGNCIYYVSELEPCDVDCNLNLFSFDLGDGFVTPLPILPFKIRRENPLTLVQTIWINPSSPN